MNPNSSETFRRFTVVESTYYPDSKQVEPAPIESINEKETLGVVPTENEDTQKRGVKFDEENIFETKAPVFSTYSYDQNETDPNFFKKKLQSYYYEAQPLKEIESSSENGGNSSTNSEDKEVIIRDFLKAKALYMQAFERMRLAGIDEGMLDIFGEADNVEAPLMPSFTSSKCDVSAKQSTYVGYTDM
uniref:Uncharacterized protein n=1 Tax=Strongyloides venezuelensis TaxID=75913 RepID=A0A0K0EWG8_STRVS